MKINAKRINPRAELPQYMTQGSSGMDVSASIDRPVILWPSKREMIPSGWSFEIPVGYEIQVRSRSGLALRNGITCFPGTIDSDYRGEVGVVLVNLSDEPFTVQPGMRIAQFVCSRVERVEILVSDQLTETSRGVGGFGHTGT